MRKLMVVLMGITLIGLSGLAQAKPEGKGHQGKPQASERMSDQGEMNTNSPASGDQLKGDDRSDERHAMDHDKQGKHGKHGTMGKGHGKGKNR